MSVRPQLRTWAALLGAAAAMGSLVWPWAGHLNGCFVLVVGFCAVMLAAPHR